MSHVGLTLEDRIRIIRDLPIPQPAKRSVVFADGESANVDDGSALSFIGNLEGQMKARSTADVSNSLLLAQLAATAQADRNTEVDQWYKIYVDTLGTVGWIVENFSFTKINNTGASGAVDAVVVNLAAAYLTGGELTLFQSVVDSLKDSANDGAYSIFNTSSKDVTRANFQLGVASNAQGNALMKIGAHYYIAHKEVDTVLFFTWGNESIEFYAGSQSMVLNESLYAQLRDEVLKKLGANALNLIADIKL